MLQYFTILLQYITVDCSRLVYGMSSAGPACPATPACRSSGAAAASPDRHTL